MPDLEISYEANGSQLVARMTCTGPPPMTRSNNRGWYGKSRWIDWRCNWRLSVDASFLADALSPNQGNSRMEEVARVECQPLDDTCATIFLEHETLEIRFDIPDCIVEFNEGGWGCNTVVPVAFRGDPYTLRPRLLTHPPDAHSTLRRSETGIDFLYGSATTTFEVGHLAYTEKHLEVLRKRQQFLDWCRGNG